MRRRLLLAAVLMAMLLLAGCASQDSDTSTDGPAGGSTDGAVSALPPPADRPAPRSFAVTDLDGAEITLDGLRGQPVVVNFFESWCTTCQGEQPALNEAALLSDAAFVGISYRDTAESGRSYRDQFEVPYQLAHDAEGAVWRDYQVPGQPTTVVLDTEGREAARYVGPVTAPELRAVLDGLAAE